MLKYLRIAMTALGLTACVLLIALWVRSYSYWDALVYGRSESDYVLQSKSGGLKIYYRRNLLFPDETAFHSRPTASRWRFHLDFVLSYDEHPDFYMVCFPHWVPALVLSVVATTTWLPWRFSLRTLLIATTLIAVVMGAIIYLSG